jgi:hypothetical protein
VMGYHQREGFSVNPGLSEILEVDGWARVQTNQLIKIGR